MEEELDYLVSGRSKISLQATRQRHLIFETKGFDMITGDNTARCLSFISAHLSPAVHHEHYRREAEPRPIVTLSRQTGSGAMIIAGILADYLQEHCPGHAGWTVFDKDLIGKVFEEHHLPKQLSKFMPEDRISAIQDMLEELLGLHPPSWIVLRQTTETVLHLAELGHVILVGRAANIITRSRKDAFHVRLVAPLEKRIEQMLAYGNPSREAALEFIKKEDSGRKRYVRDYFQADVDDPLFYDLVINTAGFKREEIAAMIGEAMIKRVQASRAAAQPAHASA
ncbi:MAG: cytidylate kinase-like family protein [Pedosphaera parvula]|nr:cytidylate kinase-like family protein [Pedosphaera parvula]